MLGFRGVHFCLGVRGPTSQYCVASRPRCIASLMSTVTCIKKTEKIDFGPRLRPALILMLAVLTLSLGSLRRFPPPPSSLRPAVSQRCGWPVATEAAGELRLADDVGDGSGPGGDV